MPEFAAEFPRNEHGWVLFPRDQQERKSLFFPDEVMRHPAKMNFHLQQSIIEYVASSGEVLLDPFGGTGTLMIAALQGYKVVLLEIEEGYHKLQLKAKENLELQVLGAGQLVTLLHGDNRMLLPIPCDHIITSPPYASAMKITKVRKKREDAPDDLLVEHDRQMLEYSRSPRNISKLNVFLFNMALEKVYGLCYQSLRVGGTITVVIKDRIRGGKRLFLSKWVDKVCIGLGFESVGWYKHEVLGFSFTKMARSRGEETVDDEDIMIYRRV